MQERSLSSLMRRWQRMYWNRDVERLLTDDILVVGPDSALSVLTNPQELYERSSGFFRTTSHNPVPGEQLSLLARTLKRMLGEFSGPGSDSIVNYFSGHPRLWTQDFGPRYALWYFHGLTGIADYPQFQDVASFYFERLTLRASIRGRLPSTRHSDFESARCEAGSLLNELPAMKKNPTNIIEQVLLVRQHFSPEELGELFLRQLLALVGFTGIALEWQVLSLASMSERELAKVTTGTEYERFNDVQAKYPTSWRLLRTARCTHTVGGEKISPGETLILPTFMYHQNLLHGAAPGKGVQQSPLFIPFGRGHGACPGAGRARGMIAETTAILARSFSISASRYYAARPRVLSLMTPRRQMVCVTQKVIS